MIGATILAITLMAFLDIFYQLLNDDIHWWYVFVGVLLSSLLIIASAFTVVFFTNDNASTRGKLWTACLFVIIGVSLLAVWCAMYFLFWYKKDSVITGNDGIGFVKATRKQQIVVTLYVACVIDAIFAYFLCIVGSYSKALEEPTEEDEDTAEDTKALMLNLEENQEESGADEGANEKAMTGEAMGAAMGAAMSGAMGDAMGADMGADGAGAGEGAGAVMGDAAAMG